MLSSFHVISFFFEMLFYITNNLQIIKMIVLEQLSDKF